MKPLQRLRPRTIRGKLAWFFTIAIVGAVGVLYVAMVLLQQRLIRSEWSESLGAQAPWPRTARPPRRRWRW